MTMAPLSPDELALYAKNPHLFILRANHLRAIMMRAVVAKMTTRLLAYLH